MCNCPNMLGSVLYTGFPGGSVVESACQCKKLGFDPWVGKILQGRKWQPTPVFLPGKSHGQRSLIGYSPWGRKRVGHDLATKQQQRTTRAIYVLNTSGRRFPISATKRAFLFLWLQGVPCLFSLTPTLCGHCWTYSCG